MVWCSFDALRSKKENIFMRVEVAPSIHTDLTFSASVTVIHEKNFQMPQVCDDERISNITDSSQLQPQR